MKTIRAKRVAAFSAMLALLLLVGGVSVLRLNDFNDGYHQMVDVTAPRVQTALRMQAEFYAIQTAQAEMLLSRDSEEIAVYDARIEQRLETLASLRQRMEGIADAEGAAALRRGFRAVCPDQGRHGRTGRRTLERAGD